MKGLRTDPIQEYVVYATDTSIEAFKFRLKANLDMLVARKSNYLICGTAN